MSRKSIPMKKSPILNNEDNKTYDVDKSLKIHSKTTFDLDDDSIDILKIVSIRGPSISNHILNHMSKINDKKEKNKTRERIRREVNSPNGLVKRDFLYDLVQSKYKGGWKKENSITGEHEIIGEKPHKILALTFKGFVASLAALEFDEIYMIQDYELELKKHLPETNLLPLVFHYIKCNIALFLLWHVINGIKLVHHKHLDEYFIIFNEFNMIDLLPFFTEEKKVQPLISEYINLRFQFLSTQIALAKVLHSIEKKQTLEKFKSRIVNKKVYRYKSKTILYSLINDWIAWIDLASLTRKKGHPFVDGYAADVIRLDVANKAAQNLLEKFNIQTKRRSISII